MCTIRRVIPNLCVSSMAPGLNQMNAMSCDNLVLSMIKVSLLRTVGTILEKKKFDRQQENNTIGNKTVHEILLQKNQNVSAEKGGNENIESDFDENEL